MGDITRSLSVENKDSYRDGFVTLEKLNILLATNEFSSNYSISSSHLENLLDSTEIISYFDIISILFYCKDCVKYSEVVQRIEQICANKLKEVDISNDSESIHLLLDLSTCPYISESLRDVVLRKLFGDHFVDNNATQPEAEKLTTILANTYWFVKWTNNDLYELLVRKELNPVY
jgi:hypothetical protein